ncbi:hypothetical protein F5Y16DRAFT_420713 [Xylariaceae sp. FL0255]|nr:hypothetical protein F5Y16DRAFT_420713 [Xylariaceae sp. FL0255]
MRLSTALVLGLASRALGLPSTTRDEGVYPTCKNYTDTFDDLVPNPTIQKDIIGTYNGLTWQAFIYFGEGGDFVNGVIPQSGTQIAATGPSSDILQFSLFTTTPFGNIVASPSKSFDLYSFYFACITNLQENKYSLATGCVITVNGYNTNNESLTPVTAAYNPTIPNASRMNKLTLPNDYRNVKNVTIGLPVATFGPILTAVLLDNFEHCNYS